MNKYTLILEPYDVVMILKALKKEAEQSGDEKKIEEIRCNIIRAIGGAEELKEENNDSQ